MAVGKLTVTPETVRSLPSSGLNDAKLFVGVFVQQNAKHRTQAENGPEPLWKNTLVCDVPEGENYLHVELINENPNHGGILAVGEVSLNKVFEQGNQSQWVQLRSTSSNQSFGELKVNLSFNGTSSVNNVTSSFGEMNLGGGHVSYQQTSYTNTTTSHESRSSSYSSLGPANPIPENYGAGSPPPFHPPPPVAYPGKNDKFPSAGGIVDSNGIVSEEIMTRGEFEEAKAKGTIPSWAKYGGGALAGVAALGLAAWGAHEVKEHFDEEKKDKKDEHKKDEHKKDEGFKIPGVPAHFQEAFSSHDKPKKDKHEESYKKDKRDESHKKDKHEKSHKKDKKKHKKHSGSGSDSGSSSSSDSD